jgi:hypothetical protein
VFSPTDVWLVGQYLAKGRAVSYAAHFDGRRWRVMPAPGITGIVVSASSPKNICAATTAYSAPPPNVLVCWNGYRWRHVRLPASLASQAGAILASIIARSATDIWVGGGLLRRGDGIPGFVAHWNGHSWRLIPVPVDKTLTTDVLDEMSSDSHGGIWARGYCECGGPAWRLWHYTGGRWTGPFLPSLGSTSGIIVALSSVPGTSSMWAAGWRETATTLQGVILLDRSAAS